MKQLTMTKVLTPLAALAFAFGVQAAAVSTDGFESYAENASVTNATGWSFTAGSDGADDASFVTTYTTAGIAAPASCPDGMTAGSNFLKLSTEDGTLFRNMDGTAAGNTVDLNAGLFVDTDVQFTITDPSDRPEVTADDKFIIWLEDQGASGTNLCVWAKQFTATDGSTSKSNTYTLVANDGTALNITPGAWYRLTVKALSSVGSGVTFPAFQVFLNGSLLKTSGFIMDGTNEDIAALDTAVGGNVVMGQSYFPAMASTLTSLTKVGFSGEGQIDNVAVTHDIPNNFPDLPRTAITFSWDSPAIASVSIGAPFYETVTSGSILTVTPGQTFTMTVDYASGSSSSTHDITAASGNNYATVDGMVVTAVSAGAATITFTAIAKDTVDVTFDWSEIVSAMIAAGKQELSGITFTVGENGTPVSGDVQNETSKTLTGLKVGTNITITVSYSNPWTTAYEQVTTGENPGTATLSFADNVVTINTRGDGKATVGISATEATGWVADPETITAGTTAAQQYSALAGTALANADAKKLTIWAAANNVAFADATTNPGDYVNAFLLNCAVDGVDTEKAAFKANITVAADGTVTVTPPAKNTLNKDYNVTPQLKGATSLTGSWTNTATTTGYNFFKYELSL